MRKGKDVQAITHVWYTVVRGKRERRGPGNFLIFWLLDGERCHTPPILVALIVLASRESFFQKKKNTNKERKHNASGCCNCQKKWG